MNAPPRDRPQAAKTGAGHAAVAHESAALHVSGEARYTDDHPPPAGMLHAALGLSMTAHAELLSVELSAVRAVPGVVAVLTAGDVPGENACGPILADEPVLAAGTVSYVGQPIFAVVAGDPRVARRAAQLARIDYRPLPPVLDALEARARGEGVVPELQLSRGQVAAHDRDAVHRLQGELRIGGQEQFYLEGQIAEAAPTEDGGVEIRCSTQHPTEMQSLVCSMLALPAHRVRVETRRMGGGFGGKESQSALFCCVAALAARRLGRTVRLRPDRDDDMRITGKRHDVHHRYELAFDDTGRIAAWSLDMTFRAGFSADLSGPVATRAVCHADNAYFLPACALRAFAARTNTQSNTAFRGFGGPQGALAIEYALDSAARTLGLDPLDVRRRNFYGDGGHDLTPYGQRVTGNVLGELVAQLEREGEYRERVAACRHFNAGSPVLRRGIALTPVKFGIAFNVVHFNQAGALVHVYTDGSVLVNHGGTEMGQGVNTKVAQVVAGVLGIDVERVRSSATDTSKVANTSATAASTGSDLNGKAAEAAALRVRERLAAFLADEAGIDAAALRFAKGRVRGAGVDEAFDTLVERAYRARVQLWSDGFYATPGLHWDAGRLQGKPFHYYAYGAAISEVEIDILTGEWRLLRADLLHDAGHSINPAIDIGQVEGGFIQGMGWLTLEELVHDDEGRLLTHSPSTYKIPAANDCPPDLRTRLFDNLCPVDTVLGGKAVGEPPLLLAFSVFFAIRDAIASTGAPRCLPPLDAPATPERILAAIDAVRDDGIP